MTDPVLLTILTNQAALLRAVARLSDRQTAVRLTEMAATTTTLVEHLTRENEQEIGSSEAAERTYD